MFLKIMESSSGNYLVTTAIGDSYLENWQRFSKISWVKYCELNDIGIIVFNEAIDVRNEKNLYWQKFLVPSVLKKEGNITNVCYLDTDIVINPWSKNIFQHIDLRKINMVSDVKSMPYGNLRFMLKKLAYARHHGMSSKYPLDSSLFLTFQEVYQHHGFQAWDNYGCAGVFAFNLERYADQFLSWYNETPATHYAMDSGEEIYLNNFVNRDKCVNWIDYEWQAIWPYEVAYSYNFIAADGIEDELVLECIKNSLMNHYFLHFAGTWESKHWKICDKLYQNATYFSEIREFMKYKFEVPKSPILGQIRPHK